MKTDRPQPDLRYFSDPRLAAWEWPGSEPPLLFAHATGFHGRMWDHIVRLVPGHRSVAVELRGHGRSFQPAPPIPWRAFAEDVLAAARHFSLRGAIGIGHSMGGHAIAEAAALDQQLFSALVLVDPVILTPDRYAAPPLDADFVRRRRSHFASVQEMFDRFRPRSPFSAWPEEVLRNYCEFGLLPDSAGGGFKLACPPETEAAIYALSNAPESNLYPLLSSIRIPVTILRAGTSMLSERLDPTASPTAPGLASKFPNGRDVYLPDITHFIPMEAPGIVRDAILASATQRGANL